MTREKTQDAIRPSQRRLTLGERLWVTFAFTGFLYCLMICVMPILIVVVHPFIDLTFLNGLFTRWGFGGMMVIVGLWIRMGEVKR